MNPSHERPDCFAIRAASSCGDYYRFLRGRAGGGRFIPWRQDNLTQSLREDTAWVVYKLDRDAVQLLNHLLAETRGPLSPAAQDELNLRFELLYSRITLLREGEVSSLLQSISSARELLDHILRQLVSLDPLFEPHVELARLPVTALESIAGAYTATERFVIAINGYLAESATEERALLSTLYKLNVTTDRYEPSGAVVIIFLVREMRECCGTPGTRAA